MGGTLLISLLLGMGIMPAAACWFGERYEGSTGDPKDLRLSRLFFGGGMLVLVAPHLTAIAIYHIFGVNPYLP
jgi:hypothetical protein